MDSHLSKKAEAPRRRASLPTAAVAETITTTVDGQPDSVASMTSRPDAPGIDEKCALVAPSGRSGASANGFSGCRLGRATD